MGQELEPCGGGGGVPLQVCAAPKGKVLTFWSEIGSRFQLFGSEIWNYW